MYDLLGEKLLTRLRLNFSHLKEHNRHGFTNATNPMCVCGADVETTEHFLLRCYFYSTQRSELFNNLERANSDFKRRSLICYTVLKQILLRILIKILSKL